MHFSCLFNTVVQNRESDFGKNQEAQHVKAKLLISFLKESQSICHDTCCISKYQSFRNPMVKGMLINNCLHQKSYLKDHVFD